MIIESFKRSTGDSHSVSCLLLLGPCQLGSYETPSIVHKSYSSLSHGVSVLFVYTTHVMYTLTIGFALVMYYLE